MTLTSVACGDIIKVDDGLPYYARVLDKERGSLTVQMLLRPTVTRTVKARAVVEHYRRRR